MTEPNWNEINRCPIWKVLGVIECNNCDTKEDCWGKDELEMSNRAMKTLLESTRKVSPISLTTALTGDPDRTYFIGDPHFDHTNILRYCNRPFSNIEEMNNTILRNWNNTIKPEDLVFFLGDMSYGRGARKPKWWLTQLNGKIVYIRGSHDRGVGDAASSMPNVLDVVKFMILGVGKRLFYLVHNTYHLPYDWRHWVIHGHDHHLRPFFIGNQKRINVSVDVTYYKPVSLTEILLQIGIWEHSPGNFRTGVLNTKGVI